MPAFPVLHPVLSRIVYQIRKFLIHNRICVSPVSGIRIVLILDVPSLALVMHRRWLIQLAQGRRFAVMAYGDRVVRIVLEKLKFGIAAITEVSVEGHKSGLPHVVLMLDILADQLNP